MDIKLIKKAITEKKSLYIITGQPLKVKERFAGKIIVDNRAFDPLIFTSDVTAIKTAARANPAVFVMKGSVVQGKFSWADFDKVIKN